MSAVIPPRGRPGGTNGAIPQGAGGLLGFVWRRGNNAGGWSGAASGEEPCGGGTRGGSGDPHRGSSPSKVRSGERRGATPGEGFPALSSTLAGAPGLPRFPPPSAAAAPACPVGAAAGPEERRATAGGAWECLSAALLRATGEGERQAGRVRAAVPLRARRGSAGPGAALRGGACQPAGESTVPRVAVW